MQLISRYFSPPQESFFLFGPRGTGKSTLIKALYPQAIYVDFLDPETERVYSAKPERLFELIKAEKNKEGILIIDEVQKVPTILTVVHSLIESYKSWQFILTGSSSRKLKRAGADLLAGRALNCTLHPFLASELGSEFSLSKHLETGLLPLVRSSKNPDKTLQAYIALYLKEEIQMEGLVRNLDDFSRFLEVSSFSHGSLLNVSNIARECQVKRKTVENYIQILEDLLLCFQLNIFTKKAQRQLSAHPKFYLFDTGVYKALRPKGPLDRPEEINGASLEGLVAQHLKAWCEYSSQEHALFYWRTRAGVEVDFIVYGPTGLWAIEVKNAKNIYSQDTKGLETFLEDYPMAKPLLLYRGKEKIMQNNILCMSCEEFLLNLIPDKVIV